MRVHRLAWTVLDLLPAALTSYGGWGSAIIAVVHREYAARAKAEKASGGCSFTEVARVP